MDEATAQRLAAELNDRIESGQAYATNWHAGDLEEQNDEDEYNPSHQATWQVHLIPDPIIYMALTEEPESIDEVVTDWNQQASEIEWEDDEEE